MNRITLGKINTRKNTQIIVETKHIFEFLRKNQSCVGIQAIVMPYQAEGLCRGVVGLFGL